MIPPKTPKLAGKSVARQPAAMNPKKPLPPKAEMRNVIIMEHGAGHGVPVNPAGAAAIVPRIIRMIVAGVEIGING